MGRPFPRSRVYSPWSVQRVVLRVARHEDHAVVRGLRHVDPGLVGLGQEHQPGVRQDVFPAVRRVPRMGCEEDVVEALHDPFVAREQAVGKTPNIFSARGYLGIP